MGRESTVAFIATLPMSGGSCAPIENSPPGIQTIPAGACERAGTGLGTVGRNLPIGSMLAFVAAGRCTTSVSTDTVPAIASIVGMSHHGRRQPGLGRLSRRFRLIVVSPSVVDSEDANYSGSVTISKSPLRT